MDKWRDTGKSLGLPSLPPKRTNPETTLLALVVLWLFTLLLLLLSQPLSFRASLPLLLLLLLELLLKITAAEVFGVRRKGLVFLQV